MCAKSAAVMNGSNGKVEEAGAIARLFGGEVVGANTLLILALRLFISVCCLQLGFGVLHQLIYFIHCCLVGAPDG